jgi:hypothetical protein
MTIETIYYSSDVCGGTAPWKSRGEVTRAALDLYRNGVNIVGLSDEEVLRLHQEKHPNSGDSLGAATATPAGTQTL